MPTFERGGGAAENDGGFFLVPAQDGHVAGIVARGFVLLVGGLVLLIDNDHAGIFHRGKNRTSRPDDDPGMAGVDFVPFIVALAVGEMAVQDGDSILDFGEAGLEPLDGLRGECDFRNQHQSGFARIEGVADGSQVDFRFARSGHTEKQNRALGIRHFLDHGLHRGHLLGVQHKFCPGDILLGVWISGDHSRLDQNEAVLFEGPENPFRNTGKVCGLGNRERFSGFDQNPKSIGLTRGSGGDFFKLGVVDFTSQSSGILLFSRYPPISDSDGQDAANRRFQRAAVVVRHPVGQLQHRGADHWALVQQTRDLLDPGEITILQQLDDGSWKNPGAHGNPDTRADADFLGHRFRHPVIQHFSSRLIRQHAHKHAGTIPAIATRLKSRRGA